MINKKGDAWISTVLYTGIGIAIITVILTAGMPLINKVKDENIISQTRDLMASLDSTVRKVNEEGLGSRRTFFMEIKKGAIEIDSNKESITWQMETPAVVSEPGVEIAVGSISMLETKIPGKSDNILTLSLNYTKSGGEKVLDIQSDSVKEVIGRYNLIISNEGPTASDGKVNKISIKSQ